MFIVLHASTSMVFNQKGDSRPLNGGGFAQCSSGTAASTYIQNLLLTESPLPVLLYLGSSCNHFQYAHTTGFWAVKATLPTLVEHFPVLIMVGVAMDTLSSTSPTLDF